MQPKVINVARDFSRYPAGRYKSDGPYSGEHFRAKFLLPNLANPDTKLVVELDGARGYGSSFLEEAFGGSVRAGVQARELMGRVELRTMDKSLIEEIVGYIRDAEAATKQ